MNINERASVAHMVDRRVLSRERSNRLSATAVDVAPNYFPYGVKGNFDPIQVASIYEILGEMEGQISWGGDLAVPDESLFFMTRKALGVTSKKLAQKIVNNDRIDSAKVPGSGESF
ncbi:hypothetical protein E4A47_04465 [Micrococcus flavus]|uniref:Uncharacterized protein n=1 Tax=Micrococcus flavus TaxID=384602 RepID=A0A4Y8X310_9MICC|nr:hypothetical protein [Micrococcus flavus]MBB4883182.1 hypothetical protein [Micrococcus flavus]TFI03803.1 hypothetical protein E4A47_04465 [Micrococcus flavus]GGK43040.1 hypothetical protein GCM10007073_07600 [Micrococcus flavus]